MFKHLNGVKNHPTASAHSNWPFSKDNNDELHKINIQNWRKTI